MSELREQLVDCLHDRDFATFDKLVVHLQAKDSVSVAQIAYKVNHLEGFKQIVLNHPERNYSLVLQQLIACKDASNLGVWLLEKTPHTTIGQWDITTYSTLKEKVDDQLYNTMIERQAQYLEPRLLMVSAYYHTRIDFALQAVEKLQHFPLYPDRLESWETDFLVKLLSFNSIPLLENLFARCPHKIVVHTLALEICETLYSPRDYLQILDEVLDRYDPNDKQLKDLNQTILNLIEYRSDDGCVVQRLLPYYDPTFNDGEILSSALYLDDEKFFLLIADATPLEVQKEVFTKLSEPLVKNTPPHLGLLKTRIDDQELRLKLQEELRNSTPPQKTRLM